MLRGYAIRASVALLACLVLAQQPPSSAKNGKNEQASNSALKDLFEAKIKTEWEALKNKDQKAYGDLLADDYQGVEVDGRSERNKLQAINELLSRMSSTTRCGASKSLPWARTPLS